MLSRSADDHRSKDARDQAQQGIEPRQEVAQSNNPVRCHVPTVAPDGGLDNLECMKRAFGRRRLGS